MSRPSDDDREAVDRAFADMVAGYHLTADRPDPLSEPPAQSDQGLLDQGSLDQATHDTQAETATTTQPQVPEAIWASNHPLFRFEEPSVPDDQPDPDEQFVPEPLIPLVRPAWPAMVAWIAMGYAVLAVLAITLGIKLPAWAGWAALICFVGGFGILMTRLPLHRPPDAGNGAVL
jgi:hypothetical protein